MSPETWFVFLFFLLMTVPVFIGAVAFINCATSEQDGDELKELKQRVEEIESKQN